MSVRSLYPRRADGLPPGQRELDVMPRFSDKPLRWVPAAGPISFEVAVEGRTVAKFDAEDLTEFQAVEQTSDFHCVTTWTVRDLRWGGVRLADVLTAATDGDNRSPADKNGQAQGDDVPSEVDMARRDLPPFAVVSAADGPQAIFMTEDLLGSDVLLATRLNGEPLTGRHGAPLRLVSPRQYGYKSTKHVKSIDLVANEPLSSIGAKEHLRARVALEERHSKLPNWLLRVPYRLMIAPTALAGERGLKNSPSSEVSPSA